MALPTPLAASHGLNRWDGSEYLETCPRCGDCPDCERIARRAATETNSDLRAYDLALLADAQRRHANRTVGK